MQAATLASKMSALLRESAQPVLLTQATLLQEREVLVLLYQSARGSQFSEVAANFGRQEKRSKRTWSEPERKQELCGTQKDASKDNSNLWAVAKHRCPSGLNRSRSSSRMYPRCLQLAIVRGLQDGCPERVSRTCQGKRQEGVRRKGERTFSHSGLRLWLNRSGKSRPAHPPRRPAPLPTKRKVLAVAIG
jgi:hypothetical protein